MHISCCFHGGGIYLLTALLLTFNNMCCKNHPSVYGINVTYEYLNVYFSNKIFPMTVYGFA